MVDSMLFETTIITGKKLQSSKPHLSWRLDYLYHQRAALSPDVAFTVEHSGALAHTRAQTRIPAHTHSFLLPLFFSIVKWICVMEWCVTGDVSCLTAQETQTWPRQLETSFGPTRLS